VEQTMMNPTSNRFTIPGNLGLGVHVDGALHALAAIDASDAVGASEALRVAARRWRKVAERMTELAAAMKPPRRSRRA
jgi:hypothetical protein